jgi:hypothetical protein
MKFNDPTVSEPTTTLVPVYKKQKTESIEEKLLLLYPITIKVDDNIIRSLPLTVFVNRSNIASLNMKLLLGASKSLTSKILSHIIFIPAVVSNIIANFLKDDNKSKNLSKCNNCMFDLHLPFRGISINCKSSKCCEDKFIRDCKICKKAICTFCSLASRCRSCFELICESCQSVCIGCEEIFCTRCWKEEYLACRLCSDHLCRKCSKSLPCSVCKITETVCVVCSNFEKCHDCNLITCEECCCRCGEETSQDYYD